MPRFYIRGSDVALRRLSATIEEALNLVTLPAQMKFGALEISVAVRDEKRFELRADDRESVAAAGQGLAEVKRCVECDDIVALLFDDAYLQHDKDGNVICCDCWQKSEQ